MWFIIWTVFATNKPNITIYISFLSHTHKEEAHILFSTQYYVHLIAILSILYGK